MSLRMACLVLACVVACGGAQSDKNEPQTAKQKQLQEAKASGELDDTSTNKWAGWKYKGARKDCFYVLGRRCFKTEKAACHAARCKTGTKCSSVGGGPAQVSCAKS